MGLLKWNKSPTSQFSGKMMINYFQTNLENLLILEGACVSPVPPLPQHDAVVESLPAVLWCQGETCPQEIQFSQFHGTLWISMDHSLLLTVIMTVLVLLTTYSSSSSSSSPSSSSSSSSTIINHHQPSSSPINHQNQWSFLMSNTTSLISDNHLATSGLFCSIWAC